MRIISLLVLFCCLVSASAQVKEFHVAKDQENLVKFISKAPLESFEGVTDKIDGYILWEGDDPVNRSEIYFEVELSTLDTGIGLRNRHMRDNYLETQKYPFAILSAKLVSVEKIAETNALQVQLTGTMEIHGQKKDMKITGVVTALADGGYRVNSGFRITLGDFKIKVPKLMFMKINEEIQIELDFFVREITTK